MSRVISVYSDQARRRVNAMVRRLEGTPHASPSALEGWADTGPFLRVANESGADFYQGDVVELKNAASLPDTELDDFLDRVTVVGVTPTATIGDQWGLAMTQIADRDVGPVAISGVRVARVNVTDEGHTFAVPTDGQTYLTSAVVGDTPILDRESGFGIKWAYVALRGAPKTSPAVATFTFDGVTMSELGASVPLSAGDLTNPHLTVSAGGLGVDVAKAGVYDVAFFGNYTQFSGQRTSNEGINNGEIFASLAQMNVRLQGADVIEQVTEFAYLWSAVVHFNSFSQGQVDSAAQCFGASMPMQVAAGNVISVWNQAELPHTVTGVLTIKSI